jgi:hypothetical protein
VSFCSKRRMDPRRYVNGKKAGNFPKSTLKCL